MSLTPGTRFGTFEVVAPLGAGAMGEVYRARDTRLNRNVALKVLPREVAGDPERLARLKREAQSLAAVSHPNIAAIYGLEEASGGHALVLELVEGETLAERIARGPIPVEDALPLAVQIASGLEAAHEAGLVHRDLKPANIKITPDGVAKVLDFGLAKAAGSEARPVDVSQSPTLDLARSPTLTVGSTAVGTILGTATYMAPEQARGKPVDRRIDIWAFGCVLYEMLTGRRVFDGENLSDVIASVLKSEPDWSALPGATPTSIRRILRRCLEKDRRERLQAIGDARIEIREAITSGPEAPAHVGPALKAHGFPTVPVVAAAVVAALIGGGAGWLLKPAAAPASPVVRSILMTQPFDQRAGRLTSEPRRRDRIALALSPDGRTLVVRALGEQTEHLYIRQLDRLEMTPIPGTERADGPFFSSDGAWVAFRDGAELKKVPIGGGGVVSVITRIPGSGPTTRPFGGSWQDNVIVFATAEGLWQVDANGGEPRSISKPAAEENLHILPVLLPGTRAVLFTVTTDAFRWDNAKIVATDLAGGTPKVVLENAADPHYSSSGHLLFMRGGTLMAVPFDASRLEVTGSPVAIAQNVMQAVNTGNSSTDSGAAQVAVAGSGALVYATGGPAPQAPRALAWVERSGTVVPIAVPARQYSAPRLSPDGRRFAVTIGPDSERRVWVGDAQRGGLSPVTAAGEGAFWNIWSPDGATLAYSSFSVKMNLRQADGTGKPELLYSAPIAVSPSSYTNNGRLIAYVESSASGQDIWIQDLSDPARPRRALLNTDAIENFPEFSPDGKWLAYVTNDSGRAEVFVQPYPGPGPRVQISFEGGSAPAWNRDGTELYFVQGGPASTVMVAGIRATGAGVTADTPRKLFEGRYSFTGPVRGYDVTPDGKRFLMVQVRDLPPQPSIELMLVQNWTAALKQ